MAKTLFIVESPNKAKSIAKYFPDFTVVATVGHFRDLPVDRMGVDESTHKPEYVTSPDKVAVEKKLREAAKSASQVILATDPDREGEAIAAHIANCLGAKYNSIMHRITYTEVNKKSIQAALARKRPIDWALVRAQEARRVIDRYVGYMISPVLTDKFRSVGQVAYLSAGRVQTVALKLIVERHHAIANFKPVEHYGVVAHLTKNNVRFTAQWFIPAPEQELLDSGVKKTADKNERLITDKNLATLVSQRSNKLVIIKSTQKDVKVAPPKPLTTSTYVTMVSTRFKLTTKQAMQVAQSLFELGLITYHRTDSPVMSPDCVEQIRAFAAANRLPLPQTPRVYKASDAAQEGHECLRVVDINQANVLLGKPIEEAVYHAIWEVTISSQLDDAIDKQTQVVWANPANDLFLSRGSIEVKPGFRLLKIKDQVSEELDNESSSGQDHEPRLPPLAVQESIVPDSVELQIKKTQPPAVYTEKTLVQKLEALGIGRPSTYASIIETIVNKSYVTRDAKLKFNPCPAGIAIIATLDKKFQFTGYDYTAQIERQFDLIASQKSDYFSVVKSTFDILQQEIGVFKGVGLSANVIQLVNQLIQSNPASAPAGKPRGQTSKSASSNGSAKPSTKSSNPKSACAEGSACPSCTQGKTVIRTFAKGDNAGKQYFGCSKFPECRFFQWRQ